MTVSPGESCRGYCRHMGYRGHWYVPFGSCTNKVRAVSVFLAQIKFKYLGVLFTSDCKIEWEWCGDCSNADAVPVNCGGS